MSPLRNPDGSLAPERDLRWVRPALMAEYLGIKPWCLWKWRSDGHIPAAACKAFGKTTRYRPASVFALMSGGVP